MKSTVRRRGARCGKLASFDKERFEDGGIARDVYRKGRGPAVVVMCEFPGISAQVLGLADHLVDLGCTAVVPSLFGRPGRKPMPGPFGRHAANLQSMIEVCIRREFNLFAAGRSSPIVTWLRALARREHERCGGPGVGVIGLCFTGGFGLAMAADRTILAPVLGEPSLPIHLNRPTHRAAIDCEPETLEKVARRCEAEGLEVLGLRFKRDPYSPGARFRFLREKLGDGFVAVELEPAAGHPNGPLEFAHSVLTLDLIDEPGEPTRVALEQVLELMKRKLLSGSGSGR